jgi:fluoride exporter
MESALNRLALMTPVSSSGVLSMRNMLIIGAGGAIGAVLRYLVVLSTQVFKEKLPLPLGTLLVNVLGCLLIGILATLAENGQVLTAESRNFLIVGILGAFTTFSTFGYESVTLLQNGFKFNFFANLAVQLVLGLGAVWAGINLVHLFQRG